jgi:hypothetical protein
MSKPLQFILGIVLVAGGTAAAIYFGTDWFRKSETVSKPPDVEPLPPRQAVPVPKSTFKDVTAAAGIRFTHHNGAAGSKLLPETMGGGVCVLDYDADGRQDLLFVNSCPWPGHKGPENPPASCLTLYRNKGDGTFEDATAAAGLTVTLYGMGVCSGDYDNDGFPDLFVTGVGGNKLYRNTAASATRKFTDVTAAAGIAPIGEWPGNLSADQFLQYDKPIEFPSSATFLDYDGDGKLDLFVCRYVKWAPAIDLSIKGTLTGIGRAYLRPQDFEGSQCALYRNRGDGRFEDVTDAAGVKVTLDLGTVENARPRPVAKALGVIVCDPDNDGWPDIVVANDMVRNFFFHNLTGEGGARQFKEDGGFVGVAYAQGSPRGAMGIDCGEYAPGKLGVAIANFSDEPITFLSLADPKRLRFVDLATANGIAGPSQFPLKFGTFFFDYDLDGRLDLLVCNGHLEPEIARVQSGQTYAQPALLFWNTGLPDRVFEAVGPEAAGKDLFTPLVGRGSAFLDYDDDGDLDVVLVGNNGPAMLLRNDTNLGHNSVRLTLAGDGKTANASAIGAQVTVEAGGKTYRRDVTGGRGYLSQSELPVTIGLGPTATIDKVTVRWPGKDAGAPQVWTNLKANARHVLRQGKAEPESAAPKK